MKRIFRVTIGSLLIGLLTSACSPQVDTETRLKIARENEQRGEYITAILELKNVIQVQPGNLDALTMLGRLALYAGQSSDAVDYLTKARELGAPTRDTTEPLGRAMLSQGLFDEVLNEIRIESVPAPERGRVWLVRGEALLNLGRLQEASGAFMHARDDRYSAGEAYAGLARIAISEGDDAKAERLLTSAFDADPFSVPAHRALGALRLSQQRYEEAETAYVRAVEATEVRPGSDELLLARVGLTETQWRMGQKGRALGNAKDLLDAYPWHPLPRYLRALLAYDSREYALATDYLREVLLEVPRHRPSQQLLAASEYELGHYSSCELLLRNYLAKYPVDVAMRRLLAATHLRMGNPPGAIAVLLPVVDLAPDDSEILALLGKASLHSGDARMAATYYEKALAVDPGNDDFKVSLIVANIGAGQIEKAERGLAELPATESILRARSMLELVLLMRKAESEKALQYAKELRQSAPANLHAMLALAELAESRGDQERATDWLEMARSRNPRSVEPRLLLVRYYNQKGDFQRAHDVAVEAVQIHPHQAEALIALAQQKLALGQTNAAVRTFDEALRASPESGDAYLGMAEAALRQGNIEAAGSNLGRAIEIDTALMPRVVALVLELADEGQRKEALQLANQLQRVSEHLPHGYTAAGDLHLIERRFTEALAAYQSAMKLSDDPVVALKSFIAAREAGQSRPSRLLQEWLVDHPDDKHVRRILANAANDSL